MLTMKNNSGKIMISIICVYNNKEILDNFLIKSLNNQTKNYDLILLDNTKNKFKSAAEALNYGGKKAKGKYLMFIHQDMDLCSVNTLETFESILNSITDLGIAGVAGKKNIGGVITNIKHGIDYSYAGRFQIKNPTKVQTLDECLIIIPKSIFCDIEFDENVCDNWHLYAVDYSLNVKTIGLNSYVIPLQLYHKSNALSYNNEYYITLEKLLNKHKNSYRFIYTTMGSWSTFVSLKFQRNNKLWRILILSLEIISKKVNSLLLH